MNDFFQYLTSNPLVAYILLFVLGVLVVSFAVIYLRAFFEGREISFWPLRIGEKPNKSHAEKTSPSMKPTTAKATALPQLSFIAAKELDTFLPLDDTIQQSGELLIAGVALSNAVQRYSKQFVECLNRNARLRFMVLDPDSRDVQLLAEMHNANPTRIRADIELTLDLLEELISYAKATKRGLVEVRLLQREPSISFAISNPKAPNGYMTAGVRIYGQSTTTRPHFIVQASDKWFVLFNESCEKLWLASPPWPKASDRKNFATPRAGTVVYRRLASKTVEILLVTARSKPEEWIFPVGMIDQGETLQEAAIRECAEESGYEVKIETELGVVEADDGVSVKRMTFFLAHVSGETPVYETDRSRRWVEISELPKCVPVRFLPIANIVLEKFSG